MKKQQNETYPCVDLLDPPLKRVKEEEIVNRKKNHRGFSISLWVECGSERERDRENFEELLRGKY